MLREKDFTKILKSIFMPASKMIIHNAIMLITGEALIKDVGSYKCKTGPRIIPKRRSHIISGILVLS